VLDICFQIALVVFLAHIGSFVPADSAVVGLTDRFVCVWHVSLVWIKGIIFCISVPGQRPKDSMYTFHETQLYFILNFVCWHLILFVGYSVQWEASQWQLNSQHLWLIYIKLEQCWGIIVVSTFKFVISWSWSSTKETLQACNIEITVLIGWIW
jgi:hypothetical protein